MLKTLALVILLAGVLPISGEKQSPKPDGDKAYANNAEKPAPPPSTVATCEIKQDGTAIECKWPERIPEGYFSRLFTAENTPNIGLFFVGLGGVLAAIGTLLLIRLQVIEMRRQVQASHDGSKAWIVGRVFEVKPKSAWPEVNEASQFFWEIENQGQTPAFITSVAVDRFMLDSIEAKPPKPLVDNAVYTFLGAGRQERHIVEFTPATVQKAREQGKVLKVYAAIKYRDIFGESRETGFSFRYHFNTGPNDPIEERFFPESDISYNYNR